MYMLKPNKALILRVMKSPLILRITATFIALFFNTTLLVAQLRDTTHTAEVASQCDTNDFKEFSQQGIALHTRMIVQQQNYLEMEPFYQLCQQT